MRRAEAQASRHGPASPRERDADPEGAMGHRILILESGIPVVPFDQSLLLRKEHEVLRAATGEEAIRMISELRPSLIITDDRLADMEVQDFVKKVRLSQEGRHAALILLSGSPLAEKPEGVNTVLRKPIVGGDFNEACRRLLSIAVRKDARLLVYVQVQGYVQSSLFLCNSLNLSASGILILTARRLKLGDSIQLQITLPLEKEKVRVTGQVVREAREVDSRLNAYGIQFEDIGPEDRRRIQNFVDAGLRGGM